MLRDLFIYRIRNKVNGKAYIGWTVDPKRRWRNHQLSARNASRNAIHRAIAKYGVQNFEFQIIEQMLGTIRGAHAREIQWIKREGTFWPAGYNLTRGGDGGPDLRALSAAAQARRRAADPGAYAAMCKERNARAVATRKANGKGSESARRMWANRTPEERAAITTKLKTAQAKLSPEERSERARNAHAKFTPEERRNRSKHAISFQTPEDIQALADKGRAALAAFTPEQRSEIGRKGAAARTAKTTHEQRSAISKANWEKWRQRKREQAEQKLE
jgi:group I intron endonuclease